MAEDRTTSPQVAKKASRVLRDPAATADEKSVAASALAQVEAAPQPTNTATPVADAVAFVRLRDEEPRFIGEGDARRQLPPSPTVEIAQGEYRRVFVRAEQPFAVASTEELQALLGTGLFEVVE